MGSLNDLASLIARHAPETGMFATASPRLSLFRADEPTIPIPSVYEASLCLIAQGAKQVSIADRSVTYDANRYLLVSVDLPLTGRIISASRDAPYLCCKIDLDMSTLADLIVDEGAGRREGKGPVLAAYPVDPDLIDAAHRLVKLLDQPSAISALAPLIEREIFFRLLRGPHGETLRHIATAGTRLNQVSRAVAEIQSRFREPLRIRELAAVAGMSESSFYDHFRAVTRLTPLEYRKQLRLQEARRLMLAERVDAGAAGFAVGYESASQFSREYRRLFGAPPRRDISRMQGRNDPGPRSNTGRPEPQGFNRGR